MMGLVMARPQEGHGLAQDLARSVMEGWEAKERGLTRKSCPYGYTEGRLRAGWLAGWHDCDQAMGNRWAPEYD